MRRRGNISLKLVAQMLGKAGFSHIITLDMHSKESQGFFDCAIDNLRASPFLIQYIQESVSPIVSTRSDCKRPCLNQLNAHILEHQQIANTIRCVRSADQNMAAYNRPLSLCFH